MSDPNSTVPARDNVDDTDDDVQGHIISPLAEVEPMRRPEDVEGPGFKA